jgi:GNAT superfamily N-acetyltransferase
VIIRAANPADAVAVAEVHVRSWQVAYRGLLPQPYLDSLRAEDRANVYDFATADPMKPYTLVAERADGSIAGFATTCHPRDHDLSYAGELCALYVDPPIWDQGFGVALIAAARSRLVGLGFSKACLWLLDGNVRGARFYEKDGWAADGQHRSDTMWGVSVNESRYQRELRR